MALGSHFNPFPRPVSKISTVHVDEDVPWLDLENLQRHIWLGNLLHSLVVNYQNTSISRHECSKLADGMLQVFALKVSTVIENTRT